MPPLSPHRSSTVEDERSLVRQDSCHDAIFTYGQSKRSGTFAASKPMVSNARPVNKALSLKLVS